MIFSTVCESLSDLDDSKATAMSSFLNQLRNTLNDWLKNEKVKLDDVGSILKAVHMSDPNKQDKLTQ